MKMDQNVITNLITFLIFMSSLIGWGIGLESRVSDNSASVTAFEKVQEVRWEENSRRLDALRRDLMVLENYLRRDEE